MLVSVCVRIICPTAKCDFLYVSYPADSEIRNVNTRQRTLTVFHTTYPKRTHQLSVEAEILANVWVCVYFWPGV
jgi:hypothetical protein